MESMFESVLKLMETNNYPDKYVKRLEGIVQDARDIGWGYHDNLKHWFNEWQEQKSFL